MTNQDEGGESRMASFINKDNENIEVNTNQPKQATELLSDLQQKIIDLQTKQAELESELRAKNEELAVCELRHKADIQNYIKRYENEKLEAIKFANKKILQDITLPLDQLFLALSVKTQGDNLDAIASLQSLYQGIVMTKDEFVKILANYGLKRLTPEGQKFDPNLHQAISQVNDASKEDGIIITCVQAGYELNGRVVKPAMVIVNTKGN